MLTVDEAVKAVRDGQVVKLTVGTGEDDPVLLAWVSEGEVMSLSIGGWSAGVVEPVCAQGSDFLETYYFAGNTRAMEIASADEAARAREIHYEW